MREHIVFECWMHEEYGNRIDEGAPDYQLAMLLGTKTGIDTLAKFIRKSKAFTVDTRNCLWTWFGTCSETWYYLLKDPVSVSCGKGGKKKCTPICAVSVHEGAGSGLARAMACTNRKDGWGNASVLTKVGILTVINFLGCFLRHWW